MSVCMGSSWLGNAEEDCHFPSEGLANVISIHDVLTIRITGHILEQYRNTYYNITKWIPSLADPGPELIFHSVTRVAPKPSWYHEVGGSVVTEECYISYEYYYVVACMQIWIHGQHIKGSDNSRFIIGDIACPVHHWQFRCLTLSFAVSFRYLRLGIGAAIPR